MCIRHDTLQLLKWTEPLSSPNFHSGGEGGEGPLEEGGLLFYGIIRRKLLFE